MKSATTRYGLTMGRGVKRPSSSDDLGANEDSLRILSDLRSRSVAEAREVAAATKRLSDLDWLSSRLPAASRARGISDAFGRSKEEQDAIGGVLLRGAFACLASRGWAPPDVRDARLSLGDALWEAHDVRRSPIDIEYAKRLLGRLEGLWWKWESHPLRTQLDVMRLLQAAIALAGVEPPPMPARFGPKRRGGWVVSHGRRLQ